MKKPERVAVPASRARRTYDRARDATYVNVDIKLAGHTGGKDERGAPAFAGREVTLTFQLIYRGASAGDLVGAYLIVESTAAAGESDALSGVARLEVGADDYRFDYERADYKTESVALEGAARGAASAKKELAAFKLPAEDLPILANANRLELKLGSRAFTIRAPQLTEIRRTLAAGAKD